MYILCDTCSVLMLIRIAPDMFCDDSYGCVTIRQEFSGSSISPLGIINDWLEKGLVKWDNNLQAIIEDWDKCNEHPQPKKEIKRFEKNTGFKYTGP